MSDGAGRDTPRRRRRRLPWVLAVTFLSGAVAGGSVVALFTQRPAAAWRPTGDNRPAALLAGPSYHPLPAARGILAEHPVSPTDLAFGEVQARRMVQDR